jgi:acyl carrier protein
MELINQMDYSLINNKVKEFLQKETYRKIGNNEIDDNKNLLESGIIDSLGLIRLIEYLENVFSVNIPDEEVLAENFENMSAIIELIVKLRKVNDGNS